MAEQVAATILKIGQAPLLLVPQDWSFPTQEIAIAEVVDEDINSSILYLGVLYYASETASELITAANAGGGGGGGGLELESYQNSAMSAPVMAYVFRDEEDNIFRVYEPIRNNDVSRSQFAYADSIDLFPFDSVDCFNSRLNDVKLVAVADDVKIQSCVLSNMIINATDKTGLQIIRSTWNGNYGETALTNPPHDADLYVTGNNVQLIRVNVGQNTYLDSLGDNCIVRNTNFYLACDVDFNGHTGCIIETSDFLNWAGGAFDEDDGHMQQCFLETQAYLEVHASLASNIRINQLGYLNAVENVVGASIGQNSSIDSTGGTIGSSTFGDNTNYTIAGTITGKNYIALSGTTYLIGEAAGAATLTAV